MGFWSGLTAVLTGIAAGMAGIALVVATGGGAAGLLAGFAFSTGMVMGGFVGSEVGKIFDDKKGIKSGWKKFINRAKSYSDIFKWAGDNQAERLYRQKKANWITKAQEIKRKYHLQISDEEIESIANSYGKQKIYDKFGDYGFGFSYGGGGIKFF